MSRKSKTRVDTVKGCLVNSNDLAQTLKSRGNTYGDFSDNASVAQMVKDALKTGKGWETLRPVHKEALDQMASKMSRIVTGDPEYQDNWDDIGGFAKITSDRCQ